MRNTHGALLESRPLPPASDLKRAFIVAMLEHIDEGWLLGEFGSRTGVSFCTKGSDRRMVSIGKHAGFGAAHLASSPGHDDYCASALSYLSRKALNSRPVLQILHAHQKYEWPFVPAYCGSLRCIYSVARL